MCITQGSPSGVAYLRATGPNTGLVILVSGQDAGPADAEGAKTASWEPLVVAGPGGASFGLRGRF